MTAKQIEAFIKAYGNIKIEMGLDVGDTYSICLDDPLMTDPIYGGGDSPGAALEMALARLKERVELWRCDYADYYNELEIS
jgi:hypothetical protein